MADRVASRLAEAREILIDLQLPSQQRNDRTAYCLLALLDLMPARRWARAQAPLLGITPIIEWVKTHYGKAYAPNTRETFRRQSMHQFVEAGIAVPNPDKSRPINSPNTVYQIEPTLLDVLRTFGTRRYPRQLASWLASHETLVARYASERAMQMVPVKLGEGKVISLSPGVHSKLMREIIEQFAPRFAPGAHAVYVGDTGDKWGFVDREALGSLKLDLDAHGKMPDVLLHDQVRNWLFLVEAVTSHGPVDGKRHDELRRLFSDTGVDLVFVSAFPDRKVMTRHAGVISWETEVWIADAPSHLIHFNGPRFLGPYPEHQRKRQQ